VTIDASEAIASRQFVREIVVRIEVDFVFGEDRNFKLRFGEHAE
jgi:hypothetical protein